MVTARRMRVELADPGCVRPLFREMSAGEFHNAQRFIYSDGLLKAVGDGKAKEIIPGWCGHVW